MSWKPDYSSFKPEDQFLTLLQFQMWIVKPFFEDHWTCLEDDPEIESLIENSPTFYGGDQSIVALTAGTVGTIIGQFEDVPEDRLGDLWNHACARAHELRRAGGAENLARVLTKLEGFLDALMLDYEYGLVEGAAFGDYISRVVPIADPDHDSTALTDLICDIFNERAEDWFGDVTKEAIKRAGPSLKTILRDAITDVKMTRLHIRGEEGNEGNRIDPRIPFREDDIEDRFDSSVDREFFWSPS